MGFGFPKTWTPLIGLRLLLGIFEAGFFPGQYHAVPPRKHPLNLPLGCVYLISTWYVRYDLQKRYSIFYLIGCLASACSGILAYGLMQMAGTAGLNGWSWIFIIEGKQTVAICSLN